jgi:hypothetical protein
MFDPLQRTRIWELPDRRSLAVLLPPDSIGCELGVAGGDHAEDLLRHAKPRELHLVDNWSWPKGLDPVVETARIRGRFAAEIAAGQVHVHPMSFAEYLASIPDGSLDWAYVDGAHDYANVSRDVWQAWTKVRAGGILCGHDFAIRPDAWRTGVCRAVIELIQNGAGTLVALSSERMGDWALRVADSRRGSNDGARETDRGVALAVD